MEASVVATWGALAVSGVALFVSILKWKSNDYRADFDKVGARLETLDKDIKARASKAETENLFDRMGVVEAGQAALRSEISHLPSKDQVHDLALQVSLLSGQIATLTERVAPIRAAVDRIEEVMMAGSK